MRDPLFLNTFVKQIIEKFRNNDCHIVIMHKVFVHK